VLHTVRHQRETVSAIRVKWVSAIGEMRNPGTQAAMSPAVGLGSRRIAAYRLLRSIWRWTLDTARRAREGVFTQAYMDTARFAKLILVW